jgi:hypothetical protein
MIFIFFSQLADEENSEESSRAQFQLVQQMELFCNFCGQRYGDTDDSLQALNCSHIFHEKLTLISLHIIPLLHYFFLFADASKNSFSALAMAPPAYAQNVVPKLA